MITQAYRKDTLDANAGTHWKRPPFPCGLDSWALPSVVNFGSQVTGVLWGDFSNMNGGAFPKHSWHRDGIDIDGSYAGYSNRDAAAAMKMLAYLNTHGLKIAQVFVAFDRSPNNPFWNAIKDVVLADQRLARDVIFPDPGHKGHFHWRLNPQLLQ